MKIKYIPLHNSPCPHFICEICGKFASGYLKCTGFTQIPLYVCKEHTHSINAKNPLLVSYLELLSICH